MSDHLVTAYRSLPAGFACGDGCYLWDDAGKQYLDALCGISVTSLGHSYPPLTAALQEQAASLLHTSNLYTLSVAAMARRAPVRGGRHGAGHF